MVDMERLAGALGDWRAGGGRLRVRVPDALARATEQGALPAGGDLPGERGLAGALAVSRTTVVAAYRELRDRGLAMTRHGSGTMMRIALPSAAGASSPAVAGLLARARVATPVIDLSVGAPELDDVVTGLTVSGVGLGHHASGHGY